LFVARLAGRNVRGRLPLTGQVEIAEPIEESTARLTARTGAVSTGSPVLDRLLAGPGFLDARAYPEISFQSDLLVWVPAGWRAVGRLQVKNAEHELACQLGVQLGDSLPGSAPRLLIACSWVIDSIWVTKQRLPARQRRRPSLAQAGPRRSTRRNKCLPRNRWTPSSPAALAPPLTARWLPH
jgi:hypothetical protein